MAINTIHFVCGLGQTEGKPFADVDLLAFRLAAKYHPTAEIFVHTSNTIGTGDNYKAVPKLRRVTYDKSLYGGFDNWQFTKGEHMSDKLRLHVLLSCKSDNALYLDTDAYCVSNLDHLSDIEGCAMARLSDFHIANGLIYAGKDRSFIQKWYNKLNAVIGPPKSALDYSCRMPHELSITTPGLTVLDAQQYHGVVCDAIRDGFWSKTPALYTISDLITTSRVIHLMSPRPAIDSWTMYAKMLVYLPDLLEQPKANT